METSEAEKRTDAKRFKLLAEPKGGCLSAGLWERSAPGFSCLDGIFGRAYPPGTCPTKEGWVLGQLRFRGRLYTQTHTHTSTRTPVSAHAAPSSLLGPGRKERRVVTPASARARPSAPAISAGRSAGTRTPSPAAQSTAEKKRRKKKKTEPAPSPRRSQTPGRSQAWSRPSQAAGAEGLRLAPAFVTLNLQTAKSLGPAGCGS